MDGAFTLVVNLMNMPISQGCERVRPVDMRVRVVKV